jgi:hypothetical protein
VAKKDGEDGWREAFNTAFRAGEYSGGIMGYLPCAISLILYLLCLI